jgi:hypothetical protein
MLFAIAKNYVGIIYGALIVGVVSFTIAIVALIFLEETFKKDINYVEDQ